MARPNLPPFPNFILSYSYLPVYILLLLLPSIPSTLANVEKTIFLGPPAVNIPLQPPTLANLGLDVLTPETATTSSLRTRVEARFPDIAAENGKATWFLLDDLREGQRYEVRVCWAATQPTAFSLETYELQTVWDTPELIASLNEYSLSRQLVADSTNDANDVEKDKEREREREREASVLLLRVLAAADYFTTNATLMRHPPPVRVDLILDPFLLNVLPRSLAPTAAYAVAVAIASWFVARGVVAWIRGVVVSPSFGDDGAEKKRQ